MTYFERLNELIAAGTPVVTVTIVHASGSVPNEIGSKMIVTGDGIDHGTVGGGQIEKRAIDLAVEMLNAGEKTKLVEWNLDRDLGMTCGGVAKLFFEAFNLEVWNVVVFGAGHVGNAVANVLSPLNCRITFFDPREEWLAKLPRSQNVKAFRSDDLPAMVKTIPDGAFVLVMTTGHVSDKPVLLEILRTREFPFVGVIGSRAKAKKLREDVVAAGLAESAVNAFHCPVGLPLGSNDPHEIAISIAAQLLLARDGKRDW